jgi:beta-glucosidase
MMCTKEFRLSFTKKAEELVKQMSLEEKVYLMSGRTDLAASIVVFEHPSADLHYNSYPYPACGNKRLNVPDMYFCDGPRGVVCEKSTCFPVTMARGATFDTDLEEKVGEAVAKEIRAYGGNFYGGVCINLPYNPGWGRSQETYGEDNFHIGAMGSALVKGVQSQNVMACIKHFAFNSMENGRFDVSVNADIRTEREVYLDHFKACIDSGAACVMSSYNKYKGTYCGQQKYLLSDVLKKEWDFDGFVVSDFVWGTRDTVNAANAGLDVEMCDTHFYGENLVNAVKAGKVNESKINEAAVRIVRTLLAFSAAKDPQEYPRNIIGCVEHINLAKKVAEESITLIQNNGNVLPFSKTASKKIAVIGKLGNNENIGDHGSSRVYPPYVVTPLAGISKLMDTSEVVYYAGENSEKAAQIAAESDAVIIVAGYEHSDEGEYIAPTDGVEGFTKPQGGDRKNGLGLHADDVCLIKTVGAANKNTAVVLIGGNMIMIDEWKDSVSSILMAYYPGMEGGTAVAEILFGDVNPGGKLPFVVVKDEKDLPQVDWLAHEVTYDYFHGYTKLDKEHIEPSVSYGFGMSYTTFKIKSQGIMLKENEIIASCKVANTGTVDGDEVVQFYIGTENSRVARPVKKLLGFRRVFVKAGEEVEVEISCPVEKLGYYSESGWKVERDIDYVGYIGTSSSSRDLTALKFSL